MPVVEKRDIIVTGIQPWDIDIGSNCKNIALEMSKHNRVLYVNPPIDSITMLKKRHDPKVNKRIQIIRGKNSGLEKINENLWTFYPGRAILSINWIKSARVFNLLNRKNNKVFAGEIKKQISAINFRDYILFTDSDMFRSLYMDEFLKPELWIYYIRDNLITQDYFRRHGTRTEAELIAKADFIASNSGYLADYAGKFNARAHMVGQGCDLSIFQDEDDHIEVPEDIKKIPGPVIGYIGFLTSMRLDIEVLEHIASSKPNWQLVLIGPEDETFKKSKLHDFSNVHFFGFRAPDLLPNYLKGFDIALNPQLINDLTIGNYPRKIDEYLAMGKPTVATKTTFMAYFADYTYLASSKEEYVSLIEKALDEHNEEKANRRKEFANQHSWENNVKNIYELIEKYSKQ